MAHTLRLAAGFSAIAAVWIFGYMIDATLPKLFTLTEKHNVSSGPFAEVAATVDVIRWLFVPGFTIGIVLWMLYGTVQEERREEVRRRVGP